MYIGYILVFIIVRFIWFIIVLLYMNEFLLDKNIYISMFDSLKILKILFVVYLLLFVNFVKFLCF